MRLIFLLLISVLSFSFCNSNDHENGIRFQCVNSKTVVNSDETFNVSGVNYNIDALKFYVSDVCFQYKNGDSLLIKKNVLVDVLDSNSNVIFPDKRLIGLSRITFSIGVDSSKTMEGVFNGDLDPAKGMFWSWQSGYINFKLEYHNQENVEHDFHIGGFMGKYNSYRTLSYEIPTDKIIQNINFDIGYFMKFIQSKEIENVMSPNGKSIAIVNEFENFFLLDLK